MNSKREKLLMMIILILVMVNSATLILMWVNKPPFPPKHPHHGGPPDKIIIERLKLDETQIKEFEIIKKIHQEQMRQLNERSQVLHKKYFELLEHEKVNDSIAGILENELALLSKLREKFTFQHFQKLKSICKPEQIGLFNDFIGELGKILSAPKGPPPGK